MARQAVTPWGDPVPDGVEGITFAVGNNIVVAPLDEPSSIEYIYMLMRINLASCERGMSMYHLVDISYRHSVGDPLSRCGLRLLKYGFAHCGDIVLMLLDKLKYWEVFIHILDTWLPDMTPNSVYVLYAMALRSRVPNALDCIIPSISNHIIRCVKNGSFELYTKFHSEPFMEEVRRELAPLGINFDHIVLPQHRLCASDPNNNFMSILTNADVLYSFMKKNVIRKIDNSETENIILEVIPRDITKCVCRHSMLSAISSFTRKHHNDALDAADPPQCEYACFGCKRMIHGFPTDPKYPEDPELSSLCAEYFFAQRCHDVMFSVFTQHPCTDDLPCLASALFFIKTLVNALHHTYTDNTHAYSVLRDVTFRLPRDQQMTLEACIPNVDALDTLR